MGMWVACTVVSNTQYDMAVSSIEVFHFSGLHDSEVDDHL